MGKVGSYTEDIFETIIRIEFNRGIAVLDLSYTGTIPSGAGSAWVFALHVPPDFDDAFNLPNLNRNPGYIPITRPADLNVVNPVSKDMRTRGLEWSAVSGAGRSLTFFNPQTLTPKITDEFEFYVVAPPSIPESDTTIYWIWGPSFLFSSFEDNLEHRYTTGDGHGNVVSIPLGFASAAERADFLSVGFTPPFETHETTEHEDANSVNWVMKFATYRTSNFNLSAPSTPAWTTKAKHETSQSASAETTGSKVFFTLKKNLQVSSRKEPYTPS